MSIGGAHCGRLRRRRVRLPTDRKPSRRQVRIEKTQRVGRFDDPHAFPFLLLNNLLVKLLHSGPMELRTKVVLGVVAIIKPDQIIPFVVGAYSPGDRLIGVASVMKEISVQVGATMPEIVKREKEDPKLPI